MPMKFPPKIIYEKYSLLGPNPSKETLTSFIFENFDLPDSELEDHQPTDWKPSPQFLDKISSSEFKLLSQEIHKIWKSLIRKFNHTKYCSTCYSSLDIKHPFAVPGGRFREFYYWDSYWVIEGLLISEMFTTAKFHIQNLIDMVKTYGFVPNGGRIYYINRSQPPLLTLMVYRYFQVTNDKQFLQDALPFLDQEYQFWMKNRTVPIGNGVMNIYHVLNKSPRPESYKEDFDDAERSVDKKEFFINIASGAESGWDFSSRWFKDEDHLHTIQTRNIIPVDLNAILYKNEVLLSSIHKDFGNLEKFHYYSSQSKNRFELIQSVLFKESSGCWYDYNYVDNKLHEKSFPSNYLPLWAGAFNPNMTRDQKSKILDSMKSLMVYPAGVPSSLKIDHWKGHQQWDFPNSWAPIEMFMIEGLNNLKDQDSSRMAYELADKWTTTVYCAWEGSNKTFFEKYNATKRGYSGAGGEYHPQTGFGWTNGVILMILKIYPDLKPMTCNEEYISWNIILFIVFQVIVTLFCLGSIGGLFIYLINKRNNSYTQLN